MAGRPLQADSKLARAVRESGMPAYRVAAAAGLALWQLQDYYKGRKPIPQLHLRRLCAVLMCDPEELVG